MSEKKVQAIRLMRVLRYNRNRIKKARSLFSPVKSALFNTMPFLLHVNHPAFPGFVDDANMPFGLAMFSYRDGVKEALKELYPEHQALIDDPKSFWPRAAFIESLSLIGSVGTTAQSEKSDLDYWVCVDGKVINGEKWDLLQQKLTLIEQWVWQTHHLEVHFFLSDIERVRNNDFGAADGESAGSAQPMLLKNEYYSTTILISGKIPFWWITPFNCSNDEYQKAYAELQKGTEPNPKHFIDLGNVEKLETNEMFGATIWQLSKAMDSPFKSVLKMAKLEVFIDDTDKRRPLCNVLKKRIHQGAKIDTDLRSTDPYALMFDTIIKYYEQKNPKFIELFKACLYIKSDCALTKKKSREQGGFKRELLTDYVRSWKWKQSVVQKYDNVKNWEFQEVSLLGQQIHSFLIGCYRRLSEQLQGQEQLVSSEDMTVIGRKVDSFYSAKEGKIQYLKRAFETGLMQLDITITSELDLNFDSKQRWTAFRGRQHYQDTLVKNPCFLKVSSDPVDLVLWCIFNRIIDGTSQLYVLQMNLPFNAEDISELMDDALSDYQPISISDLSREKLLAPSQITHCLLVVNFSSRNSVSEIETVRVIYLTSWGELYSFDGIQAFENIKQKLLLQDVSPECRLFTPKRNKRKVLYDLIEESTCFEFEKVM